MDHNTTLHIHGEQEIIRVTREISDWASIAAVVFIAFCGLLVFIFMIWMFFKLALAKDDAARKSAKSHVVYAIVGLLGIGVMLSFILLVIPETWTPNENRLPGDHAGTENGRRTYLTDEAGIPVLNDDGMATAVMTHGPVTTAFISITHVVDAILSIFVTLAIVFAVYLGWQFMKAEDENKRKNAKKQLFYTILGGVGILLLMLMVHYFFGVGIIDEGLSGD